MKKKYLNFELKEKIKSPEINSEIFIFKHKILGTELIFIKNKDKEKAFTVSFKTPSPDSKGYQHILEHSVLRSSERYDFGNKEVFTDILKKSSLTFLNAATYDDKTVYPFSTMLESEFFKVMNIYTDAVLNPLCVKNENYFKQEGWR
jgi:Zn-dependent M16 (insulinase) family peptidase